MIMMNWIFCLFLTLSVTSPGYHYLFIPPTSVFFFLDIHGECDWSVWSRFTRFVGNVYPSCPQITCRTTQSASEGQPSRVACLFEHDVREDKTDFRIVHYTQATKNTPEVVLICTFDGNRAYPMCTTANGYTFEGDYGQQVTLNIPWATKGHEGTYVCESGASGFQQSRVCTLQVNTAGNSANKTSHTRCQTKTPVTEGQASFIKCTLAEDPKENNIKFGVLRYDTSGNNSLPEHVMDCSWLGDKPNCITHPGYSFDNDIGKQLTLAIPKATLKNAGIYSCHVSGSPTDNSSCCPLEVHELSVGTMPVECFTGDKAELGQSASVTCVFPPHFVYGNGIGIYHFHTRDDGSVNPVERPTVRCFNASRCETAESYEHVNLGNNSQLAIQIQHLENHQLGQYSCMIKDGDKWRELQNCTLSLSSEGTESKSILPLAIGVPVLLVLVLIIGGFSVYWKYRKNGQCCQYSRANANEQ